MNIKLNNEVFVVLNNDDLSELKDDGNTYVRAFVKGSKEALSHVEDGGYLVGLTITSIKKVKEETKSITKSVDEIVVDDSVDDEDEEDGWGSF